MIKSWKLINESECSILNFWQKCCILIGWKTSIIIDYLQKCVPTYPKNQAVLQFWDHKLFQHFHQTLGNLFPLRLFLLSRGHFYRFRMFFSFEPQVRNAWVFRQQSVLMKCGQGCQTEARILRGGTEYIAVGSVAKCRDCGCSCGILEQRRYG